MGNCGQVFILANEVDSFLTSYSWSNNAAQDNQPLPPGYNCISPPMQLFLHFFLTAGSGFKPEPKHFGSIEDN